MDEILKAVLIMGGLTFCFSLILAVSNRLLHVEGDPRVEGLQELLPGANCGACGEAGCQVFAESLAIGEHQASDCSVASADIIDSIADFLDIDPGIQIKRVARLHCAGGLAQAHQLAEYRGFESCSAAALVSCGGKGCPWGCLGLGDCHIVCQFDAIKMNNNGLPQVDTELCTACGDCVEACPQDLFEILPLEKQLLLQCRNPLAGEDATALCSVACDGCGKCAADANPGSVRMEKNLPFISYEEETSQNRNAIKRCPTGAIVWLDDSQAAAAKERNTTGHWSQDYA